MDKISVLLPTKRDNEKLLERFRYFEKNMELIPNSTNFKDLLINRLEGIKHYLEPTLKSLEKQKYKNLELIISHRNPSKDEIDTISSYNINCKLVKEKPSIWHDLGVKYPTLCNNINTAFIHSTGELLWRLDDLTFFDNRVTQELINNWNNKLYTTSRAIRCIEYDDIKKGINTINRLGPNKVEYINNGWSYQYKPLSDNLYIPMSMCWGFSSTISKDEFIELNGQDELWDGAICGTDMELGRRLDVISKYKRVVGKEIIYELDDVPYKSNIRDDVMFRKFCTYKGHKANCWKPDKRTMRLYKRWHEHEKGELDLNWNKMLDVPYIDVKKEYEKKLIGEIIYDSCIN